MDVASGRPEGHTGLPTVPLPRQPTLPHFPPHNPHAHVVEPLSSRQDFIREFALLRGVSRSALDAIWRSNKRGYNAAHDAHFDRFRLFFRETKPTCRFAPENILPGDLVNFLQRMSASGSAYASIKDASASISMACRKLRMVTSPLATRKVSNDF
jgi:hypothetical protein